MTTAVFTALVVIAAAVALLRATKNNRTSADIVIYARTPSLATQVELRFYEALRQLLAPDECVMAKVRLIDVLQPTSTGRAFHVAKAKVIQKHLDFVICDRETLAVRYAIEINDRSHESPHRRRRDEFVEKAMKSAGIPLFFVPAQARYDVEKIRANLSAALSAQS